MFNLAWFKNLGEEGNTFELNKSLKSLYEGSFKFSVFPKVLPKFELRPKMELETMPLVLKKISMARSSPPLSIFNSIFLMSLTAIPQIFACNLWKNVPYSKIPNFLQSGQQ